MEERKGSAFITTKKGFCYLTVKIGRNNFNLMRIRNYTIDAEDKRDMRRWHPDILFDWKKIEKQLAKKRGVCRRYRSRRREAAADRRAARFREVEPPYAVFDPLTRTVYTGGEPSNLALLDAIIRLDCTLPSVSTSREIKPRLKLVKD